MQGFDTLSQFQIYLLTRTVRPQSSFLGALRRSPFTPGISDKVIAITDRENDQLKSFFNSEQHARFSLPLFEKR